MTAQSGLVVRSYQDMPVDPLEAARTVIYRMVLDIVKARDGIRGSIPFTFNGRTQQFSEGVD